MSRRLLPPVRGAADWNNSADTPPDTCPPHAIRNVRLRTGTALRQRAGKRPGQVETFSNAIGGGSKVQLLDVIAKAAGTTYSVGTTTGVDGGTSVLAQGLIGQAWFLDQNRAMFRAFRDPYPAAFGSTSPTPANAGAFVCSWHPDGSKAAIGIIIGKDYTDGGGTYTRAVTHINFFNPDTNTLVWHALLEDKDPGGSLPANRNAHRHLPANSVRVYTTFTYVSVGPFLYVFRTGDGTYIKRENLSNAAWEVMDCRLRPDNTLAVLYWGNPVIAGPVVGDTYHEGSYFRSGIKLYGVTTDTTVNGTPLTLVQFGVKKTNAYAYYEDHLDFRFSEHSLASPRGCMPQGFGMGADGSVVVGRSNQGFGPTVAFPPDSTVSPPITVCKISAGTSTATMLWEHDTASAQNNWETTGWYNDLGVDADGVEIGSPPAGPEQSIQAIDVSQTTGDVYAAGKKANGFCVFGLRSSDGTVKWRTDLGGTIYQHCVKVDPVTGLVVVVGQRNDDWIDPVTGAPSSVQAHLWWLDPQTGEVRFHFDLDHATGSDAVTTASAFSLDISSTGRLVYTTVHIG